MTGKFEGLSERQSNPLNLQIFNRSKLQICDLKVKRFFRSETTKTREKRRGRNVITNVTTKYSNLPEFRAHVTITKTQVRIYGLTARIIDFNKECDDDGSGRQAVSTNRPTDHKVRVIMGGRDILCTASYQKHTTAELLPKYFLAFKPTLTLMSLRLTDRMVDNDLSIVTKNGRKKEGKIYIYIERRRWHEGN